MPWRARSAQAGEVLQAEALERDDLVREARQPVADAVGERGDHEAAVAPARAGADALGLEHDDVARGVVGLGVQRGPQPGEAAADDAQVGLGAAVQRRARRPRREVVEPERRRRGVGVGGALLGGRRRGGPRAGH